MFAEILTQMTITQAAIDKLKEDRNTLNELAVLFRKSEITMRRWLDKKDSRLTTIDAIKFIKEKTGLTQSQILN